MTLDATTRLDSDCLLERQKDKRSAILGSHVITACVETLTSNATQMVDTLRSILLSLTLGVVYQVYKTNVCMLSCLKTKRMHQKDNIV